MLACEAAAVCNEILHQEVRLSESQYMGLLVITVVHSPTRLSKVRTGGPFSRYLPEKNCKAKGRRRQLYAPPVSGAYAKLYRTPVDVL